MRRGSEPRISAWKAPSRSRTRSPALGPMPRTTGAFSNGNSKPCAPNHRRPLVTEWLRTSSLRTAEGAGSKTSTDNRMLPSDRPKRAVRYPREELCQELCVLILTGRGFSRFRTLRCKCAQAASVCLKRQLYLRTSVRNAKVRGSIPLISTNKSSRLDQFFYGFFRSFVVGHTGYC